MKGQMRRMLYVWEQRTYDHVMNDDEDVEMKVPGRAFSGETTKVLFPMADLGTQGVLPHPLNPTFSQVYFNQLLVTSWQTLAVCYYPSVSVYVTISYLWRWRQTFPYKGTLTLIKSTDWVKLGSPSNRMTQSPNDTSMTNVLQFRWKYSFFP